MTIGCCLQLILRAALPRIRSDRRNRETFAREANSRRENFRNREQAMSFDEINPSPASTRDSNRMRVKRGQFSGESLFL
jgi:hypothetical protein